MLTVDFTRLDLQPGHLVLDMGAGYELKTNRTWALAAFIAAFFATAFVVLFVASRFLGV